MTEPRQEAQYTEPLYKRRNYLVPTLATIVVLIISAVVLWTMHDNATDKINAALQQQERDGVSEIVRKQFGETSGTDPVGFDLANYLHAKYPSIVLGIYFVLAALGIAVLVRFALFMMFSTKRDQYYPNDASLDHFLRQNFTSWEEFCQYAQAQDHLNSRFWRILKDSVLVTTASGRVDHLYLHLRNRIDRITENMDEMSLYDSIATASPAAGFFGTLIGFLYIFSQGQSAANLSQSLEFTVGLKVAIITSLWGLLNLGLAIAATYFSRRMINQIHDQMVVRAVAVCEIVESLRLPQGRLEGVPEVLPSKEHLRVRS